jgi:hypothetical protein
MGIDGPDTGVLMPKSGRVTLLLFTVMISKRLLLADLPTYLEVAITSERLILQRAVRSKENVDECRES